MSRGLSEKKLKRLKFLIPQAKIIYSELNVVLNCYHQCDMAFNRSDNPPEAKWHADLAAKIQNLPAYTVLAVLWPHVYPEYLDLTLYLNAFDMRNWPTVPYKAYHTPTMLYDTIIGIVDRRLEILTIIDAEDDDIALIVMPRRTEAFFEIRVTHPSLLMTPALWQTYCTSLQHRDSMEHLRELGGHIEPLTWDEGQGQGVIVRLPWAKSVL